MELTIVIPFRNSEKYIEETIHSILKCKSTFANLIFINNDSEDTSVRLIKKNLQTIQNRYKIIHNKKNLGYSKSVHIGMQHIATEFGMILNADDLINNDYIIKARDEFKNSCKIGLITPSIRQFGNGIKTAELKTKFSTLNNRVDKLIELFSGNPLPASGSIYRINRKTKSWSNTKNDWASDWELALNYALSYEVLQLPDEWIEYRVHNESLSNTFDDSRKDIYYLFMQLRIINRLNKEWRDFDMELIKNLMTAKSWMGDRFPLTYNFSSKLLSLISEKRKYQLDILYDQKLLNTFENMNNKIAKILLRELSNSTTLSSKLNVFLNFTTYKYKINSNKVKI
jgi:glycosyltransferase involved in cell wall biosynthesis